MADHQFHTEIDYDVDGNEQPEFESSEIVIGTLVDINSEGHALVDYIKNPLNRPITAISAVSITPAKIKRQVALLFADRSYSNPIVIGFIHSPLHALLEAFDPSSKSQAKSQGQDAKDSDLITDDRDIGTVNFDDERVVIEGKKEIVLRCGDASITLTRAGKVIIRGNYLLNRSSGVNRIMGGSVQVN